MAIVIIIIGVVAAVNDTLLLSPEQVYRGLDLVDSIGGRQGKDAAGQLQGKGVGPSLSFLGGHPLGQSSPEQNPFSLVTHLACISLPLDAVLAHPLYPKSFIQNGPSQAILNHAYLSLCCASGRKTPSVHKGGNSLCPNKGLRPITGTGEWAQRLPTDGNGGGEVGRS